MDSLSSPSSTLESDYSDSQSPPSAQQPSRSKPKILSKEKGKGKKAVKKHPAIGFRVREANSVLPAPQSGHPLLSKADDVWKFEQNLRMRSVLSTSSPSTDTMPAISPIAASGGSFTSTGHRSRSSSTSQYHPQPVDSSLRFGTPVAHSSDERGMPPRKRAVLQDIREQQLQPPPAPFVSHTFDQGHCRTQQDIDYNQLMPPTTFGQCPTIGTMDPTVYAVGSSTHSPYLNNISVPEHTSAYDPQLPLSSIARSTTYFSPSTSYGPPFSEQLPSSNVSFRTSVSGSASIVDSQPAMMPIPSTPAYEQQPAENYSPHPQVHHMQHHPYQGHLVSGEPQPSVDIYDSCLGDSTGTGILGW
jgi:hypothetical protein